MRENRPSGSEGGVAFGPSLPLSGPFVNPPWAGDIRVEALERPAAQAAS